MRFELIPILLAVLLASLPAALGGDGCGINPLDPSIIGGDTVTPVGYDRPWLEKSNPSPIKNEPEVQPEIAKITEQNNTKSSNATEETSEPAVVEDTTSVVAGRWSITMIDSVTRYLDMTLSSVAANMMFGKGNLTQGNDSQSVSATGSLAQDNLRLKVIYASGEGANSQFYSMNLLVQDGNLSGSYETWAPGDNGKAVLVSTGNASGKVLQSALV